MPAIVGRFYRLLAVTSSYWRLTNPGQHSIQGLVRADSLTGVLAVSNRFQVSTGANNPWFGLARPGTTLTKTDVVGLGERNRFQVSTGANSP